jgi:hypothetical protein
MNKAIEFLSELENSSRLAASRIGGHHQQ